MAPDFGLPGSGAAGSGADLAGVSADYYARLEQGRHLNISVSVLDAVARALRLLGSLASVPLNSPA